MKMMTSDKEYKKPNKITYYPSNLKQEGSPYMDIIYEDLTTETRSFKNDGDLRNALMQFTMKSNGFSCSAHIPRGIVINF